MKYGFDKGKNIVEFVPEEEPSNTRIGNYVLMNFGPSNGTQNTAIGDKALSANTKGFKNIAIGALTLNNNVVGS